METNKLLEFYKEYEEKLSAYELAISTMYFDMLTVGPKAGSSFRNKMMSILEGEVYSYLNDEDNVSKLEALNEKEDLDDVYKEALHQRLESIRKARCIPKDEYIAFQLDVSESSVAWEKAKNDNDYEYFKPYLKKVFDGIKRNVAYRKEDRSLYESLLNDYEPGMDIKTYDAFFGVIKEKLVPFIQKIQKEGKKIDDSIFKTHYPASDQALLMKDLKSFLHVNEDECYMGESEHPFTMKLSSHDARITTRYVENNIISSTFSTIHEYGHALYGLQVNPKFDGTPLAQNMSMGMHESQSRLLENHIGKNPSTWKVLFPKLIEKFPEQLKGLGFDTFMEKINVSYPSFIRIDADELTYPLHVLIRYELEKEIINGDLDVDHLEQAWNDKYKEYLGVEVQSPKEGVLQDTHWGSAMVGYFPTYALGSAFAAQFYHQMQKDLDVDAILRDNEFFKIAAWLKENIHQYGSFLRSDAILRKVTNETFNPNYYVDYLIDKFTNVYLK